MSQMSIHTYMYKYIYKHERIARYNSYNDIALLFYTIYLKLSLK